MKIVPRVRVEAPVRPTESLSKVKRACLTVFPDLTFTEEGDVLVGVTSTLDAFRELVRNQKIRDATRDVLIRGMRGTATSFVLSKQAAFAGVVNFSSLSPLGDLRVTIEDDDLEGVIDDVAESTKGRSFKRRGRTEGT